MGSFLQNFEKWAYISRKILKNGYLFLSKMRKVSKLDPQTPVQTKSEYPSPVLEGKSKGSALQSTSSSLCNT